MPLCRGKATRAKRKVRQLQALELRRPATHVNDFAHLGIPAPKVFPHKAVIVGGMPSTARRRGCFPEHLCHNSSTRVGSKQGVP